MEFNNPSEIVKDLNFGYVAREKIINGVNKLASAVSSTLGASGKCVIYEDALGRPVITKDGVTVAQSVVLNDPVENIGATLVKEAANNTVREAGDGTTTATVLAHSIITHMHQYDGNASERELRNGINTALNKITSLLDEKAVEVSGEMLNNVATISCNNDAELGNKIGEAYNTVGKDGVVLMDESGTNETIVEFVDGVQFDSGLKSQYLITDKDKMTAVLDAPYVLIMSSPIPNIRKIQSVLEHVQNASGSLLIIAEVEQQPYATLLANKVKGNIKVNIIDTPGFGNTKEDTLEDLAILTGAKVISEQLGDDLDLIDPSVLGRVVKSVTDSKTTVLQISDISEELEERIDDVRNKIKNETNQFFKKKLEQRLAMLSGKVGVVKVGADSKVELKEKKDRVEDAIAATKAAIKEGIVPGGGVALMNCAKELSEEVESDGEKLLYEAILAPFRMVLFNAGMVLAQPVFDNLNDGEGINVITGETTNMVEAGIIDPVLVTKTALKNAVSVSTTIMSADCVISNMRSYAGA